MHADCRVDAEPGTHINSNIASSHSITLHLSIGSLSVAIEQVSKDGTRKRAYVLDDGQLVESVLMPYNDGRRTACISSQAGCGMGCTFCATGQMGFVRHLTATEIFEQAQTFAAELKALLVFAEHRYYGESLPLGPASAANAGPPG